MVGSTKLDCPTCHDRQEEERGASETKTLTFITTGMNLDCSSHTVKQDGHLNIAASGYTISPSISIHERTRESIIS